MTDSNYDVKDASLATQGRFKVEWAEQERKR
jgi:S-adenosylhomocysteine hydrolase